LSHNLLAAFGKFCHHQKSGEIFMKFASIPLALAGAIILTACGGGGGGGAAPAAVAIGATVAVTAANAKAMVAVAIEATANPFDSFGPLGVFAVISNNPTPSVFVAPQNCAAGGTAILSGSIASFALPASGDQVNAAFASCAPVSSLGSNFQLSGNIGMSIGSSTAAVVNFTANYSGLNAILTGLVTYQYTGDQASTWDTTNTSAIVYNMTGTSLATKSTKTSSGIANVRNNVWKSYNHRLTTGSTGSNYLFNATLQSDNPLISAGGGTFLVTTPTQVLRSSTTSALTSGSIKIVGTGNTSLVANVTGPNALTIQIDANGDGVYESTVTATTSELFALQ
jgi:hypothetical protein